MYAAGVEAHSRGGGGGGGGGREKYVYFSPPVPMHATPRVSQTVMVSRIQF